jgi:hypothetical protein
VLSVADSPSIGSEGEENEDENRSKARTVIRARRDKLMGQGDSYI